MPHASRVRRPSVAAALSVGAALVLALAVAGCGQTYPNSTFQPHTDFGRAIDDLWNLLLRLGTLVFIFVEGLLVVTIIRYRRKPGASQPRNVHGNTRLEILWTVIPAVVLVFIAVPTVRTIFQTEARATADALQVDVYGHQWWWEFQYPQYGVVTANELYLPIGRKVNFSLRTKDVLHSFWIPQLGGKRDLISNRTNYLWFTTDSTMATSAWNGTCNEYCGASHANMRFRVFVVPAEDFQRWAAHTSGPAIFNANPPAPPAPAAAPAPRTTLQSTPGSRLVHPVASVDPQAAGRPAAPAVPPASLASTDQGYVFPRDRVQEFNVPSTPVPEGLTFTPNLVGDAARGQKTYSSSACIGCHTIKGNPMSPGITGPNLTHIGSRYTIAAGTYPNDTDHLRLWIKNARLMKPGVIMPTLGLGQTDPQTGAHTTAAVGGLTDQQIADIVAYLQALK